MSIEARIERIGVCLFMLKERLEAQGYRFQEPNAVLPGPSADLSSALDRVQCEVGTVPVALKLFYERIGSVNFLGSHPEWTGCEYPDALLVDPLPEVMGELDNYLDDPEGYIEAYESFRIPIAPDYYHKEDVSGGMWYGIAVPGEADDPPLLEEWHHTTFLHYLEIAIGWGGFPGLQRCPGHNWPILDLISGT